MSAADQLQSALAEKDERGFRVGTRRKWKGDVEVVKTKEGWQKRPSGRSGKAKPHQRQPVSQRKATERPSTGLAGLAGRLKQAIGRTAEVGSHAAERAKEGAKRVVSAAHSAHSTAKAAAPVVKKTAATVATRFKGLPDDARKLASDREHRSAVGKKMGEMLRRKAVAAAKNIVHELKELKEGGAALKKLALRQPLSKHDRHALKECAKTIGMTVAGTIAIGGIGHLTAAALGTHFAIEALVKHVGKAALFAHAQQSGWPIYESDEGAMQEVVERVIAKVAQRLEGLGSMSDDEIAGIVSSVGGGRQSSAEPEGGEKDSPKDEGPGIKLKGERDWKPKESPS